MIRSLVIGVILAAGMAAPAFADVLTAARWKHRVLVVAAPAEADERLAMQRGIVRMAADGMRERDMIVIEAIGSTYWAQRLRRRLGLGGSGFRVLLIGKDGHTALSASEPLSAEHLFRVIDAMPMRRDEMRSRR